MTWTIILTLDCAHPIEVGAWDDWIEFALDALRSNGLFHKIDWFNEVLTLKLESDQAVRADAISSARRRSQSFLEPAGLPKATLAELIRQSHVSCTQSRLVRNE